MARFAFCIESVFVRDYSLLLLLTRVGFCSYNSYTFKKTRTPWSKYSSVCWWSAFTRLRSNWMTCSTVSSMRLTYKYNYCVPILVVVDILHVVDDAYTYASAVDTFARNSRFNSLFLFSSSSCPKGIYFSHSSGAGASGNLRCSTVALA